MAKITKQQYKKSIQSILASMEKEALPMGAVDKDKRRKDAQKDFWFFFHHYLPHYGAEESPEFHKEIIELLEKKNTFTAIAAPRGFAKSTLVSFTYVLWNICTEQSKFVVIVSSSDDLSRDLAGFIRLELTDNKRIIEDYGDLLINMGAEGDFIANKTRILARGRKQAVRGFRHRQHRPDLIIIDDIEKDEEALNPKVVLKTLETIKRGLIPSLAPGGRFILVGTILRLRSAAGTILLSDEEPWNTWTCKVYSAMETKPDGTEQSIWESRFTTAYLQEIRASLGRAAFNAEYQNMPTDDDTALFYASMIKEGGYPASAPMAIFVDPSVDGIKSNDYKAAVLAAKTPWGFVVVDAVLMQGRDTKFFDSLLNMYTKHKANILKVAVECIAFMVYFVRDLNQYAKEKGVNIPIATTSSSLKKENRIAQLAVLFETDKIFFEPEFRRSAMGKLLIDQLLYFPNSAVHDDGPDALAGAIKILEACTVKTEPLTFFRLPKPWGRK